MNMFAGNAHCVTPRSKQRGAAAIEFAFLFAIFFIVLYAAISYSLVMLVQQALTQAAAEGARAAVGKLDPLRFTDEASRRTELNTLSKEATKTALSWLPAATRERIVASGVSTTWTTKNMPIQTGDGVKMIPMSSITVTVTYANYLDSPLLPILRMPGYGPIPSVPQNLVGKATLTP